ncbi:MAG: phosphatidylinositol-specific phospholipase C1-like protein [Pirellulales bacterium]
MLALLLAACSFLRPAAAADRDLRLNQIQVIGTHNSYHRAPPAQLLKWIALAGQSSSAAFDYTHRPLPEQFSELGIRQIELDVFADPKGGHYSTPAFRQALKDGGEDPGPDPNADGLLDQPGLKVLHVQDLDYLSTTPTFRLALRLIHDWSRAHPTHVPILILVELKDDRHALLPTKPIVFDQARIEEVDREILSVFPRDRVLMPDDVRGSHDSLRKAIAERGWPRLEETRGKVLFALDNEDAIRDRYLAGHEALRGRVMFVSVDEGNSAAAWFKINDVMRDFDRIQRLVRAGYVVRTRADSETREARLNDTIRRDRAFASGAQWISTDFPEARVDLSQYEVRWENRAEYRLNPIVP